MRRASISSSVALARTAMPTGVAAGWRISIIVPTVEAPAGGVLEQREDERRGEDLDAAVAHRVGGDVGRDGARHSWTAPGSSGMPSGFTVGAPAMQADAPGGRSRGR